MRSNSFIAGMFAAVCSSTLLLIPAAHAANDYPAKPIEMIVPYSAGGGTDLVMRAFADTAKKYLSKPIGVINKTGGGGAVGFSEMAAARPTGYTIGAGTVEFTQLQHLGIVQFRADDFIPVARINAEPAAISVNADSPWKTYEEFIDHAKANPGKVRIGNAGTGATWHLAAVSLAEKTGAKFNLIAYDGGNPAAAALLGNHIEAVSISPAEVINYVKAGKIRVLAVMADKRLPSFPEVPTLKEKNVDLSILTWRGIVVPKKTPQNVIDVLRVAAKNVAEDPAFKEALDKMNLSLAYLDAPEFKAAIDHDSAFYSDLMTKLGLAKK